MKINSPLYLGPLLLTPFLLGFIIGGLIIDSKARIWTALTIYLMLVGSLVGVGVVISLVFRKKLSR